MKNSNSFRVAALAASIALAMTATSAMAAAPTATQLPGKGTIVSAPGTVSAGTIADNAQTIDITGHAVINWGKGTAINKDGVGGFNIGSGATLTFNGTSGADPLSSADVVLNIDSSGNASQIFGELDTTGGAGVFVANANGIIVGDGATINAEGYVALIANNQGTAQDDFFDMSFNGTGGDVTVQSGSTVTAAGLFVSGGGNVNVDLDAIEDTAIVGLTAGQPFGDDGAFSTVNKDATLSVTGTGTTMLFSSAGNASSSGDLTMVEGSDVFNAMDLPLSSTDVAGTFTNSGTLSLPADYEMTGALVNEKTLITNGALTLGGLTNDGVFDGEGSLTVNGDMTNTGKYTGGAITVNDGDLTNNGAIGDSQWNFVPLTVDGGSLVNKGMASVGAVSVTGGDLTNDGTIGSNDSDLTAIDGNIVNNGKLMGFNQISTDSDDDFTAGADYSITNAGTMEMSSIAVNVGERSDDNDTTGSFTNTGVLQFIQSEDALRLDIAAHNDLDLGGSVQVMNVDTGKYADVSAKNPLPDFTIEARNGTLTIATPLAFDASDPHLGSPTSFLTGKKTKIMADLAGVDGHWTQLVIAAGDKLADDYAIRIASGVAVSAQYLILEGASDGDHPNVILQGTLAANYLGIGVYDFQSDYHTYKSVSDFFTGPNGGILATGGSPTISFAFTGRVKTAPYLNDGNFRYNGVSITATDDDAVSLNLNPTAYQTNGTSNGLSAVNLLVNGSVVLGEGDAYVPELSVEPDGTAVTGVTNLPNTHLVLQSTGNISTNGDFYWPGYVYLGTIAANADGSAAPGTLGLGMISLGGNFNNVLPGDISGAGGVHFITQFPLGLDDGDGGTYDVVTNANSWVNFGTDLLTQGYATGTLGGSFYGGTQGSGTVVNYGELDPSMFHTHAPVATR